MPKRIRIGKSRKRISKPDVNQNAHRVFQESIAKLTEEPQDMTKAQISQLMSQMGKKGGKIGGKRRMQTMSPEERSQSALRAAQARWKKTPTES